MIPHNWNALCVTEAESKRFKPNETTLRNGRMQLSRLKKELQMLETDPPDGLGDKSYDVSIQVVLAEFRPGCLKIRRMSFMQVR